MNKRTLYTAVIVLLVLREKFDSSFRIVRDTCDGDVRTCCSSCFQGIVEPIPVGQTAKDYLEQNVNKTLIKALTALCKEKPKDPVVSDIDIVRVRCDDRRSFSYG
jgi:hypothetical protein